VTSEYYDREFQDYREYARQTTLLPFHRALWYGADVKILKYLAEKHPTNYLFEMKDDFKNTALHMAIRQQRRSEEIKDKNLKPHSKESSLNVDTVRYLIHAGEMALLEPDEHGNTPLHLAIIVGSNAEIMQLLIEACTPPVATFRNCVEMCEMPCETAFLMQNRDLRTPLHLAMKKCDSTATQDYIMRSCSLAMLVSDKDGCTPMHLMMPMSFRMLDLDHVLQILQMQPGVLLKQDHAGCTPLHTLLKNMAFNRSRELPEDRQQIIVRLFTGVTPGLLARDDTKRLMRLVNAENLSPLQYYMKNFNNWNGGYYSSVVGRELQLASRC
jgi:ankyrin repeat protein